MSAIHDGPRLPGALTKLHTSIKLLVHSHNRLEPYNLSSDVLSVNLGKTIKGVGQATIELPPRVNYLNTLGPDDYVNIYFNKGDGKGWVRTFFGLIDRVEESSTVAEDGTPTTRYYLICSDFMKIFEKTQYYTNPHLNSRDDFVGDSIGNPLAHISIMSNGLLMNGGPADVVAQVIFSLLGFSGQFTLPDSYVSAFQNTGVLDENRSLRLNFAEALMTDQQQSGLGPSGLSGLVQESQSNVPQAASVDSEQQLANTAASLGLSLEDADSIVSDNPARYQRLLEDASVSEAIYSLPGSPNRESSVGTRTQAITTIARGAIPGRPPTVLDLINIGTFVERAAIDGYTFSSSIANYSGPILQLLNQFSNDIVNELYFDLRPVSSTGSGIAEGATWSTEPDELAGNVGPNGEPMGVKYVPAMIMREYPFSTIETLDGSNVTMSMNDGQGQQATYGVFPLGAIFSNKPNAPGRHVIPFPNINVIDNAEGSASETKKHLDVATISTGDIQTSVFGRSDTDHVNLLGLTSDSFLGRDAEYYMKDLAPIVTPIHIHRHGLRVRVLSTNYARYEPRVARQVAPNQPRAPQEAAEAQEAPPEALSDNVFNYANWHQPAIVTEQYSGQQVVLNRTRHAGTRWGYVRNTDGGVNKRMHNGIDIFGIVGSPIYAVADGLVEFVHRNGDNAIYGNQMLIRHPGGLTNTSTYTLDPANEDMSNDLWSVYAHMGLPKYEGPGDANGTRTVLESQMRLAPNYDEEDPLTHGIAINPRTNERWKAGDRVNAGEHIGYLGWSGGVSRNSTTGLRYSGLHRSGTSNEMFTFTDVTGRVRTMRKPPNMCHLHFELNKEKSGIHYPSQRSNGTYQKVSAGQVSPSNPPPFSNNYATALENLGSLDPVEFLKDRNCDLLDGEKRVDQTGAVNPVEDGQINQEFDPEDEGTANQASTTSQAGVENQAATDAAAVARNSIGLQGGVDSNASRNVLARWILMQDHWFQHNLEYLSGTIDLARGAPEIRVGYRLDITDRNLSFYIEGVNQSWVFPGALKTKLTVTRGQANNPYAAYIFPRTPGFSNQPDQRYRNSRLSKFFISPDPLAVRNALIIRDSTDPTFSVGVSSDKNILDTEETLSGLAETYKLAVLTPSAQSSNKTDINNQAISNISRDIEGLSEQEILTILENDSFQDAMSKGNVDGSNVTGIIPQLGKP